VLKLNKQGRVGQLTKKFKETWIKMNELINE